VNRLIYQLLPYAVRSEDKLEHRPKTELDAVYRTAIADGILTLLDGSHNGYENIVDFEWMVGVLVDVARIRGVQEVGERLNQRILDIVFRVWDIRAFCTNCMVWRSWTF
jgi:hypothetical protein